MASTPMATLREAADHVIIRRTDAHLDVDPKGSPQDQRDAVKFLIGSCRVHDLHFEISGLAERLVEAGIKPNGLFLPEVKEARLPRIMAQACEPGPGVGIRITVRYREVPDTGR